MSGLTYAQRMPDTIAPRPESQCIDITWQDQHLSTYGYEFLRWKCPCAICQGEGGVPGVLASTERLTDQQTTLTDLGPVGNYAMSIVWVDGHSTGIYSWDYLRRICPCSECAAARQAAT